MIKTHLNNVQFIIAVIICGNNSNSVNSKNNNLEL